MNLNSPSPSEKVVVLYLDYDGVAHDDDVWTMPKTREIYIKTPGRTLFEWIPILELILEKFPKLKIVLSTSWVRYLGFDFAKGQLPKKLQDRVIGATFPEKYAQKKWFDSMSRYEQIMKDVARRKPTAWIAIDNDARKWPDDALDKLVLTEDHVGLSSPSVQEDLFRKLTEIHKLTD